MKSQRHIHSIFFELFFQLTFVSPTGPAIFAIIWAIEKLIVISPSILLVFKGTDWDIIARIFNLFNV